MAKNSNQPSHPPIEFPIPEELKECGISRIVQVGPFIKTLYKGVAIPANFNVAKLKKFADEFREEAGKIITSNGIAANEIIEKLVCHVINEATNRYEKDLAEGKIGVEDNGKAESVDSQDFQTQPVTTMKYTVKDRRKKPQQQRQQGQNEAEPLPQLWETVRVGGKYYLVSYDQIQNKIAYTTTLEDNAECKKVYPFDEDGAIEHYSFESFEELQQYIETAKLYTVCSLFTEVKECAGRFYDTDTGEYITLIAADIVFTYFQDRIGKTHYIFVYGEPDQGKGAILKTFNQLAYRGASISSVTPAAVYRMLGSVEKGQITMIIDEANKLFDRSVCYRVFTCKYFKYYVGHYDKERYKEHMKQYKEQKRKSKPNGR